MSTRETPWPPGTPCWVDLAVPDLEAAKEFYGAVLGWSFVDSGEEFGHYTICQTKGQAAAAIGPQMEAAAPVAWTVYLASDDADATAKLIADNGGRILAGPMDIPGNGRMLIALDSQGGNFGVWQSAGMIGAEIANEPGSLTWTDTRLPDPAAGKAFYAAVFGYTFEQVPGAPEDYTTFHVDGHIVGGMGGMMGAQPGAQAHWLSYFSVADVDTTVAALERAGGGVVMPAEDTPFGRMGIYTDPFGATFALHMPPPGR